MSDTATDVVRIMPLGRRDQAAEIVALALRLKALIARHYEGDLPSPLPGDAVDVLDEALVAFKLATGKLEI